MARQEYTQEYLGLSKPAQIVVDPSPADIANPRQRGLLLRWRAEATPLGLPSLESLQGNELRALAGYLVLLEIVDGGRDYIYRLYGKAVAKAYGEDMTGRRTLEFPGPIAAFFLDIYAQVVADRVPIFTRHVPPAKVNVAHWDRLTLPISQAGTAAVDHILTALSPVGRRR
jgi:hypothetical protein